MANIRISQLDTILALKDSDLFVVSSPDTSVPPVYSSIKAPMSQVASRIVEGTTFSTSMPTTNKTVAGAIQEIYGTVLTSTLTAGNTTVTFSNEAITTSSTLDFYTDVFGVNPTSVTVTTGQIVLTFTARSADLGVKVRIT